MDQLLLILALCLATIGALCVLIALIMIFRSQPKTLSPFNDDTFTGYELINEVDSTQHSQTQPDTAHARDTSLVQVASAARDPANANDINTLIADHPDNSELHLIRLEDLYHNKNIELFNHYLPELIQLGDQTAIDQALHWQQMLMTSSRRTSTQTLSSIKLDLPINPGFSKKIDIDSLDEKGLVLGASETSDNSSQLSTAEQEALFASLEQEILAVNPQTTTAAPALGTFAETPAFATEPSQKNLSADDIKAIISETVTIEASVDIKVSELEAIDPEPISTSASASDTEFVDETVDVSAENDSFNDLTIDDETPIGDEQESITQHSIQFKIPSIDQTVHNISFGEKSPSNTIAFDLVDSQVNESTPADSENTNNSARYDNAISFEHIDVESKIETASDTQIFDQLTASINATDTPISNFEKSSQFSTTFSTIKLEEEENAGNGTDTAMMIIEQLSTADIYISMPIEDQISNGLEQALIDTKEHLSSAAIETPTVTITQPIATHFESTLSATTGSFNTRVVDDLMKEFDELADKDPHQINIELAQQYISLGSIEQAKNLLNDVLKQASDEDTKSQAKAILDSLHG